MCIVQRPHSEDSTGARPNMTSVFDFDDSINTVYNAKTAGKNLVTAKHEVLTKAGDFLFLAHSDREFALRCQMMEADIESAARRKMATVSDSKFKLVRALHEEWKIRHANCAQCNVADNLKESSVKLAKEEKAKEDKIKITMHQKLEKRKDHDDEVKAKAKKETKKESIQNWLHDSLLDNVILNESISFKQHGNNFSHDYLAFDNFDTIVEKLQLKSVKLDETTIWQNRPLASALGQEYYITQMDDVLLIAKHGDDRILAVKK